MSQSVGTLRNVSSAIGSELDEQAVMLDEFGAEIEQAETKLDATMRKMVRVSQCGNYGNLLSLFFGKNFVKITILLTKLLNS